MATGLAGRSSSNDAGSLTKLLPKLCCLVTGCSDADVLPHYQQAVKIINSHFDKSVKITEFHIAEKIQRHFVRQRREKDAAIFSELHRKLQAQEIPRDKEAILSLLLRLRETSRMSPKVLVPVGLGERQVMQSYFMSTPHFPTAYQSSDVTSSQSGTYPIIQTASTSSGISSLESGSSYGISTLEPFSTASSKTTRFQEPKTMLVCSTNRSGHPSLMTDFSHPSRSGFSTSQETLTPQVSDMKISLHETNKSKILESCLLRDLLYVFQGIPAKLIKYDESTEVFRIEQKADRFPKALRSMISKLTECGWLHTKIKSYIESHSKDKALGLVGQSFCAALHQELTEYYRLMAVLEGQLHQEDQGIGSDYGHMTLHRLVVWTSEPLFRLKCLAALVDICNGKKGGALASAIYAYMQHGDPFVRRLIQHVLNMVVQPIYSTLLQWIYDGELEDTYLEFFIASSPTVMIDNLWRSKYALRKGMIPSFITTKQAEKILIIGKSINFLHQVCNDRTTTKGRQTAMEMDAKQVEFMFTQDTNQEFQQMIDTAYKETSRHLLDTIYTEYKFMDHLKALRRYMLFGQGDFIRHLMDLLEEFLARPAFGILPNSLTGILETAVRSTNAQFDNMDILKRLDVRMLESSPGDTGWDVFSMDYHVDGPIRTVFTHDNMTNYLRVFNFLWRAKRMEYILPNIWKNQIYNARLLQLLPDMSGVLHLCHILCSKMAHFIQQLQYYINFELRATGGDNNDMLAHSSLSRRCNSNHGYQAFIQKLKPGDFLSWMEMLLAHMFKEECLVEQHQISLFVTHTRALHVTLLVYLRQVTFRILECSWDVLVTEVQKSEDLNGIIKAHEVFLNGVTRGCLLDTPSNPILVQLRTIFDLILQFQTLLEFLYKTGSHEVASQQRFEKYKEKLTKEGQWGLHESNEAEELHRRAEFVKTIPSIRTQLVVLATSYQDMVQKFLMMITNKDSNDNLRFLSFRLNFNEHYNLKDSTTLPNKFAYTRMIKGLDARDKEFRSQ